MKGTGGRAEQDGGVVEHVAFSARFGRSLESIGKAAEFLVDEAAIDPKIFVAAGFLYLMRQPVSSLKAHGTRQIITNAHAVFAPELVGGHARGVGLESKINL